MAQDGVRVRASAGAASFPEPSTLQGCSTLKECRRQAEEQVARLRAEIEADPGAANRRQAAAGRSTTEDRLRRVNEALAAAEKLDAVGKGLGRKVATNKDAPPPPGSDDKAPSDKANEEQKRESRASTTDPEAKVMKMADGGFRPAYNVQFVADTRSGAVAGVSVDNGGSDMAGLDMAGLDRGRMAPMNDALAATYGQRPSEHLVDGGFAKLDDIETLAQAGVTTYAPVPTPKDPSRDRHAPQPCDPPPIGSMGVAAWRRRMGTDTAKAVYKERAATVECVNAQTRNRGLTRFLVRGVEKVKAVVLWYALAHNMACTWRLTAT